ncbi:hypothetical protein KPP23_030 [Pseudomonas phage KPP23]|nr:hypothetical protein KPP23_030 [Pseudomonas phage KPP23]
MNATKQGQITRPIPGQEVWTSVNGKAEKRVFVGPGENGGFILALPDKPCQKYYVDTLWLFAKKSDILKVWLDAKAEQIERLRAEYPREELEYRNQLRIESCEDLRSAYRRAYNKKAPQGFWMDKEGAE